MYLQDNRRKTTLGALKQVLLERVGRQKDFIVPLKTLSVSLEGETNSPILSSPYGSFKGSGSFVASVARRLEIPGEYLAKTLARTPKLGVEIINQTIAAVDKDTNVLLRTEHQGNERLPSAYAVLSDSFGRLDHHLTILPALESLVPSSTSIRYFEDSQRLIVDLLLKDKSALEIKAGDILHFGYRFMNSQSGVGAFQILMYAERLVCSNGMTHREAAGELQQRHRTGKLPQGQLPPSSDCVSDDRVHRMIELANARREALTSLLLESPNISLKPLDGKALKDALHRVDILQGEAEKILKRYEEIGDLSLYGLVQAATEMARAYGSSRQIVIEEAASKLLKFRPTKVSLN